MKRHLVRGLVAAAAGLAMATAGMVVATAPAQAVVGGTFAKQPGANAAFTIGGVFRCSGTLIEDDRPDVDVILTSGDCALLASTDENASIKLGTLDQTRECSQEPDGQAKGRPCVQAPILSVEVDPFYIANEGATPQGDVGLAFISPVKGIKKVRVPLGFDRIGSKEMLLGWGWPCQGEAPECGQPTRLLKHLRVKFVDGEQFCNIGNLPSGQPIYDPLYTGCIKAADGTKSMMCVGDSGTLTGASIGVGDGDHLEPAPDWCSTSPSGGPGTGITTRLWPSLPWLLGAIRDCDIAAGGVTATTGYSMLGTDGRPAWQHHALAG